MSLKIFRTNVLYANNEGNYIIELLPHNGPNWASSLDQPTLSAVLFWKSKYNYVGLKLLNDSINFYKNKNKQWYECDFRVKWERLTQIIDFLAVNYGGYCNKYKRADEIIVPQNITNIGGFAIYNAYCPQTPDVIHNYVKMRRIE